MWSSYQRGSVHNTFVFPGSPEVSGSPGPKFLISWLGDKLLPTSLGLWVASPVPSLLWWLSCQESQFLLCVFCWPAASPPAPGDVTASAPGHPSLFSGLATLPGAKPPIPAHCSDFQFPLCSWHLGIFLSFFLVASPISKKSVMVQIAHRSRAKEWVYSSSVNQLMGPRSLVFSLHTVLNPFGQISGCTSLNKKIFLRHLSLVFHISLLSLYSLSSTWRCPCKQLPSTWHGISLKTTPNPWHF